MKRLVVASGFAAAAMLAAAMAAPMAAPMGNETINYSYDARGRLTNVAHAGTINNNLVSNYTYDKADNRLTVNVTP
jgi:YD repeat-containing protein